MVTPRALVNLVSLSRLPLALVFVVAFKESRPLFFVAVGACLLALATDILDGYLARRLGVASTHGRHWDSLGDKAFYVGVIVSLNAAGLLLTVLAWALLVREVALYITRILYIQNLGEVERIRPFTDWHGYFMYAVIVLGLGALYARIENHAYDLYPFIQVAALGSLGFGVASIFHYIGLKSGADEAR